MGKFSILILILIVTVFFMQDVSAITSSIKDNYAPKETIIGSLSGSILEPIRPEQVKLKRGYVDVAFEYDIKRLNGVYYIWLIAPQTPANYTLVISNIVSNVEGTPQIINYEKKFSVSGNLTDYTVKPGLIFAMEDFSITAELYENAPKNIEVSFPSQKQITLNPGANNIDFSIKNIVGNQFIFVTFGKYSIPAYIAGNASVAKNDSNFTKSVCGNKIIEKEEECEPGLELAETCESLGLGKGNLSCYLAGAQYECHFNTSNCVKENKTFSWPWIGNKKEDCESVNGSCKQDCNDTNEIKIDTECNDGKACCLLEEIKQLFEKPRFRVDRRRIKSTVLSSEKLPTYYFSIINFGNSSIENISFRFDSSLFRIVPDKNILIVANSNMKFNLSLINKTDKEIKKVIVVDIAGEKRFVLVNVEFTTNLSEVKTEYLGRENNSMMYYCSELEGVICSAEEVCNGQKVSSIDSSLCCKGKCEKTSKKTSKAWIGYLIAAIIILVLLIVFVKYKKVKPSANPLGKSV